MPGPPLPWIIDVALDAHSLASAFIVHSGTAHLGEAQAGVLGTPSSLPRTYSSNFSKPKVWVAYIFLIISPFGHPDIGNR